MENCEYVQDTYNVPACIGRRVVVNGKPGVIAEDRGNYIGVNFDQEKPGVIANAHPTWKVEYGEMGGVRQPKTTRSKERYQRYLEFCECFDTFLDFCYWDAAQSRRA